MAVVVLSTNTAYQTEKLKDQDRPVGYGKPESEFRKDLWKSMPNSLFKRFQELFAEPEDYRILPYRYQGSRSFKFEKPEDLSEVLAEVKISLDPRKHLTTLKLLGLANMEGEGSRLSQEVLADPEINQKLVDIFCQLESFQENNRIFSASSGELRGAVILFRQGKANKSQQFPKATLQVFSDIFDAFRKTEHQSGGHVQEVRRIAKLKVQIANFLKELDQSWTSLSVEERAELADNANSLIGSAEELLGKPIDQGKKRASDKIISAGGLRDSLDRLNPNASYNKLSTAMRLLSARLLSIKRIGI